MLGGYIVRQCYFLYAGSLCWLDGYASYADCLAMPAIHASWLANLAFLPGFLCWHSLLAAGYACCACWLAMLIDCVCMLSVYAGWMSGSFGWLAVYGVWLAAYTGRLSWLDILSLLA
jgi:hypothetical protein